MIVVKPEQFQETMSDLAPVVEIGSQLAVEVFDG